MTSLLLKGAEVGGRRADVLVDGASIAAVTDSDARRGADSVFSCDGGAVIPGLHDHHLHLLAMAAADRSLDISDGDLDAVVRAAHEKAPNGEWLRVVGYDESANGPLDRTRLDTLAPERAVRVQHRSGAMWILSTTALAAVGADDDPSTGIERDGEGAATGRLFRLDDWLLARLPASAAPDLGAVGERLSSYGVTGATDCTPATAPDFLRVLAEGVRMGKLPIDLAVTGGLSLAGVPLPEPLQRGPVKLIVADHDLPPLDFLEHEFRDAHDAGLPVAVHCVTRVGLVLALAAWRAVGARTGDRVEHASIAPPELAAELAGLGITVVTQPGFVLSRGDAYRRDVDPDDLPFLYPCASLLGLGVGVGGSTDAPFGPEDPWTAIATAVTRTTASGASLGPAEALPARRALELFLAPLDDPGGPPRVVAPGGSADLCILDRPLGDALCDPSSGHVRATVKAGSIVHQA